MRESRVCVCVPLRMALSLFRETHTQSAVLLFPPKSEPRERVCVQWEWSVVKEGKEGGAKWWKTFLAGS